MKYVWLLLLLLGLSYTWGLGNSDRDQQLALMTDEQFDLADVITDSVKAKRPDVTGVNFSQLYTEILRPGKEMIAHYRYEITSKENEETSTEVVEGQSKLVSDDGHEWQVVSSDIEQPTIGFQKGETITRQHGESQATPQPTEK